MGNESAEYMKQSTLIFFIVLILCYSSLRGERQYERRTTNNKVRTPTKNLFYEFGLASFQLSATKKNYLKNFNTITYNNFSNFKIKTYLNYYLGLNNQTSSDFSDLYNHLNISNSVFGSQSRLETYIINILPFSKNSQVTQTMYLALGGGLEAKTQLKSSAGLIIISANLSIIKFFYKKETGINNFSNTNLLANQQLNFDFLGKQIGGQIYVKNSIANNFTSQQFSANSHTEIINWNLTKKTKLGLGHTNANDILNSNQQEIPTALYQNNTSTFFISFNHVF